MQSALVLQNKIVEIYKECFGQDICDDDFNSSLADKGLDSLDVIDFIYNIEGAFDLKLNFDSRNMEKLTLNDLISQIKNKI